MAQLSEAELLAEITGLCEQRGIWLVHNDNPHHSRRRQNLAGFPDLILCGTYRVMYRELKSPMGQPTPRQTSWIKRLKGAGQDADVWRPRDLRSGRIGRELDMLGVPPPPPSERDLIDAEFARALA